MPRRLSIRIEVSRKLAVDRRGAPRRLDQLSEALRFRFE
jgi:hypothetical protein